MLGGRGSGRKTEPGGVWLDAAPDLPRAVAAGDSEGIRHRRLQMRSLSGLRRVCALAAASEGGVNVMSYHIPIPVSLSCT